MPIPHLSIASSPLPGAGPSPGGQPSAFDTMENRFFAEGDELSTPPPAGDGWTETTAVSDPRRRKHGLGTWVAVAAAVVVVSAVLAGWRASGKAEPSPHLVSLATPAPAIAPPPPPALPAPAAAAAPAPSPAAAVAPPASTRDPVRADTEAVRACKRAFDRHQGKAVLATCQRAFAEDPESADVAVILAKTEFDRGHARQALEWAKITISLDGQRADAYVFLGGAEQAAGHAAAAKVAYQRYLQLAPKGRYAGELRGILRRL